MQEGKQAVKMVKGEGKKCPKGSSAGTGDQELLVSEGHSNTETETNVNSTSQTASHPALGSPLSPLTCTVLHLPQQPALGQPTRARAALAHLSCKLSQASSRDSGCKATCTGGCFAHSDKTYLGNKLWGLALPREVRAADLVGISRWQQERLVAQFGGGQLNAAPARKTAEGQHSQPSSHTGPAAHKLSATRTHLHSCPISLF